MKKQDLLTLIGNTTYTIDQFQSASIPPPYQDWYYEELSKIPKYFRYRAIAQLFLKGDIKCYLQDLKSSAEYRIRLLTTTGNDINLINPIPGRTAVPYGR